MGWITFLQYSDAEALTQAPQNLTTFGNRVFKEVKMRPKGGSQSNVTGVLIGRGNLGVQKDARPCEDQCESRYQQAQQADIGLPLGNSHEGRKQNLLTP
jgi:hypothetical protein